MKSEPLIVWLLCCILADQQRGRQPWLARFWLALGVILAGELIVQQWGVK